MPFRPPSAKISLRGYQHRVEDATDTTFDIAELMANEEESVSGKLVIREP